MNTEFNYTIEIENHKLNLLIQGEANVWTENYGADADGNRGELRTFCECQDFKALDLRGNDLTEKLYNKYQDIAESIADIVEEKSIEQYEEGPTYSDELWLESRGEK